MISASPFYCETYSK